MTYSKPDALERIFNSKYIQVSPHDEIPFTREEVRDAIIATGGIPPDNLNNFVKDLVRTGNSDPRSKSAKEAGYYLREGSHTGSMGIFFRPTGSISPEIAVICPEDLSSVRVENRLPSISQDLIRPDEGGLVAALEYCHILDYFFEVPKGSIKRIQSPVKIQPHELDSFFVLQDINNRIPIACEAKSKGNDVITLNQIVGVAAATLQKLMEIDMDYVIPIGAKLENNGDIFLVRFPECYKKDLLDLKEILTVETVVVMSRFSLDPIPPKWI
jgi:hypothetical protein